MLVEQVYIFSDFVLNSFGIKDVRITTANNNKILFFIIGKLSLFINEM